MLADFVTKLQSLAVAADQIQVATVPDLRKVIVRKGDLFEEHDLPPVRRQALIHALGDFVLAVKDKAICPDPEVYYGGGEIAAFVDRQDRHEAIRMQFVFSSRFRAIRELDEGGRMFGPKEAIRYLRFKVGGNGTSAVIAALRKLDFTRRSDGRHHVEHGRESFGQSVEAAVQQAEAVPEDFFLALPVFCNPGLEELTKVNLQVGIELEPSEQKIRFCLLPDEIERARNTASEMIGAYLRDNLPGVPVFAGTPIDPKFDSEE